MRKVIILLLLVFAPVIAFAYRGDGEQILLKKHNGDGHFEHYIMADMPEAVYYDSAEGEIIIEADGISLYYNVEIISDYLNQTVISTLVSGYGDTIDVSSLPAGNYTIVITSEFLNEFEGQFSII